MDDIDRDTLVEEWFRRYADRVLAYLLHRTDPQTAQDILQDVFVIAYRKAERIDPPVIGWLFGTARRLLANQRRSRLRRDALLERLAHNPQGSDAATDDSRVRAAFLGALAELSTADREVLTLSCWYELTPQEAAAAVGCSPATYAVRLHRARKRFADHLHDTGHDGRSAAQLLTEALHD